MMDMLKQQLEQALKMREELAPTEAKVLASICKAYKDAGFTDEQAFNLLLAQAKAN